MVKPTEPNLPSYVPEALALGADMQRGEVREIYVLHDHHCPFPDQLGPCCCTPTVTRGFVLWFRKGRRGKWEAVAQTATEGEAWDAIKHTGRRHGDWCVKRSGERP